MDRETFRREVEMALSQLRDVVQLRTAKLGAILLPDVPRGRRGWELSNYLLQAVQSLKPAQHEGDNWPHRRFELLSLRYVNGLSPDQVADHLGISSRHYYRQLERAVDDFAELLWVEAADHVEAPQPTATDVTAGGAVADQTELLRRELAPVLDSGQSASLAEVWESVRIVLSPLLEADQVSLQVELPADLPQTTLSPELLKQFLLAWLGDVLYTGRARALSLAIRDTSQGLELTLAAQGRRAEGTVQQGLWEEIAERARRRLAMLPGATLALLQTEPDGAHYRLILPTAQTRTVLVVEDNPEVGGLFQRYLTSGGYQALLATRGAEAIALARSRRLHAITLDLVMDSADGWDVLQALRDDPRTSYIPIIVCSVLDQQQLALMLGASAFLKKPVLREHLLQALVQVERDRAGYDGEHV